MSIEHTFTSVDRFTNASDVLLTYIDAFLLSAGFRRDGDANGTKKDYKHTQSAMSFQLYATAIGSKTLIHTTVDNNDDKIESFTVDATPLQPFVASLDVLREERSGPLSTSITQQEYTGLVTQHIPESYINALTSTIKQEIVAKWMPGLGKEGYQSLASTSTQTQQSMQTGRDRLREYNEPQGYPQRFEPYRPAYNPDLEPFNPINPLLQPYPQRMPPPQGMFVGPDDPLFDPRAPHRFGPMAAPPGARFDPVMPMMPGAGRGLGRGSGGYGQFSGDPDNDELMPPGSGNMYL